jgi:hypothetical protein
MSNPGKAAERLLSGRAWDDYCDQLRQTGHMIEQFGESVTELDRTEWYRFLTRYARMGFEHYVECSEPTRPRFHDMTWRQTINFTSPLQDHFFADFEDGSVDYVITGNKGTIPYFVIASLGFDGPPDYAERDWAPLGVAGLKEFNTALLKTHGAIESGAITFDADGNFRVVVSQTKPEDGSDWLRSTPDSTMLLCRAVYAKRAQTMGDALRRELGDAVDFVQPQGGLFVWARLTGAGGKVADGNVFAKRAIDNGVAFVPGTPFFCANPDHATFRLSFATVGEDKILEGISRLAKAV